MSSQQQAKVQLQVNDLDVHKELQDERMRDMEGIADDMEHIQEMSKDLNVQVHEDQKDLDKISVNIQEAEKSIDTGTEDLSSAADNMRAVRRKRCICAVIVIVIVIILGVVLYITLK